MADKDFSAELDKINRQLGGIISGWKGSSGMMAGVASDFGLTLEETEAMFHMAEEKLGTGETEAEKAVSQFEEITKQAAEEARKAAEEVKATQNAQAAEEAEPEPTAEELLAQRDELTGLDGVKRDVRQLTDLLRVQQERKERGMAVPAMSRHLVFAGNPGTGKTTVARLVAKIYKSLGLLPKGDLVETDRGGLIAGYQGQTAIKTQEVIDKAMGGILFIDEAYSLVNGEQDTYGQECIQILLKNMEDHRDELVVIAAGYTDLMHKFIESNPGLRSRFNKYFNFEDYTPEQLLVIFRSFCRKGGYELAGRADEAARRCVQTLFDERDENFGNARTMRNLFESCINAQSTRLACGDLDAASDEALSQFTAEDVENGLALLRELDAEGAFLKN